MSRCLPGAAARWWAPGGGTAFAVLVSVLVHVAAATLFSARVVSDGHALPRPPLVTFLPPHEEDASLRAFRERIALLDPSVASLPGPRGFSAVAIRRGATVPAFSEIRQDQPQLLARPPFDPGRLALVAAPTPLSVLEEQLRKRPVSVAEEEEGAVTTAAFTRPESAYELSPSLQKRRLLTLANIPLVRFPSPPQPTVVRICVGPLGEVKFAMIERGSGAEDKDQRALDIVRRWRFAPMAEGEGDLWGTVSVYWAAEAPPAPAAGADSGGKVEGTP